MFGYFEKKSDLKYQAGYGSIITEGVPTNGYLPRLRKLLRHSFGRLVGRSNFFLLFSKEITLLVFAFESKDKRNDSDDYQSICIQVFIRYHTNPPSPPGFPLGKLAKGGFRPPLSYPFRALRPWLFWHILSRCASIHTYQCIIEVPKVICTSPDLKMHPLK